MGNAATAATVQASVATVPSSLAGTDHPALPAPGTVAAALIASTMLELGLDATDCGTPVRVMLATPHLTRAMFEAARLSEISHNASKRRALGRRLYTCNL